MPVGGEYLSPQEQTLLGASVYKRARGIARWFARPKKIEPKQLNVVLDSMSEEQFPQIHFLNKQERQKREQVNRFERQNKEKIVRDHITQAEKDISRDFHLCFPNRTSYTVDDRTFPLGSSGEILWGKISEAEKDRYIHLILEKMMKTVESGTNQQQDLAFREKVLGISQSHFVEPLKVSLQQFTVDVPGKSFSIFPNNITSAGISQHKDGTTRFIMRESFYLVMGSDGLPAYQDPSGEWQTLDILSDDDVLKRFVSAIKQNKRYFTDGAGNKRALPLIPLLSYSGYVEYTPSVKGVNGELEYARDKYHVEYRIYSPAIRCKNDKLKAKEIPLVLKKPTTADFESQAPGVIKTGLRALIQRWFGYPKIPDFATIKANCLKAEKSKEHIVFLTETVASIQSESAKFQVSDMPADLVGLIQFLTPGSVRQTERVFQRESGDIAKVLRLKKLIKKNKMLSKLENKKLLKIKTESASLGAIRLEFSHESDAIAMQKAFKKIGVDSDLPCNGILIISSNQIQGDIQKAGIEPEYTQLNNKLSGNFRALTQIAPRPALTALESTKKNKKKKGVQWGQADVQGETSTPIHPKSIYSQIETLELLDILESINIKNMARKFHRNSPIQNQDQLENMYGELQRIKKDILAKVEGGAPKFEVIEELQQAMSVHEKSGTVSPNGAFLRQFLDMVDTACVQLEQRENRPASKK